jgi:hypothetical protein
MVSSLREIGYHNYRQGMFLVFDANVKNCKRIGIERMLCSNEAASMRVRAHEIMM